MRPYFPVYLDLLRDTDTYPACVLPSCLAYHLLEGRAMCLLNLCLFSCCLLKLVRLVMSTKMHVKRLRTMGSLRAAS